MAPDVRRRHFAVKLLLRRRSLGLLTFWWIFESARFRNEFFWIRCWIIRKCGSLKPELINLWFTENRHGDWSEIYVSGRLTSRIAHIHNVYWIQTDTSAVCKNRIYELGTSSNCVFQDMHFWNLMDFENILLWVSLEKSHQDCLEWHNYLWDAKLYSAWTCYIYSRFNKKITQAFQCINLFTINSDPSVLLVHNIQ